MALKIKKLFYQNIICETWAKKFEIIDVHVFYGMHLKILERYIV